MTSAFLIAGTASGVGKTTVTLSILAALRRRGVRVQPFKAGPDFLDTIHHTAAAGRPSRNLDTWMLSTDSNRAVFREATADAEVAVVEGMMGLFDGKSATEEAGSSAEIAKLLGLPVVLVVDASKCVRSLAAMVHGFESFDAQLPLAGIILNGVGGEYHAQMLRDSLTAYCRTPVLGALPTDDRISIPERHLGLHALDPSRCNTDDLAARLDALAELAERSLDLNGLRGLTPIPAAKDDNIAPRANAGNCRVSVRIAHAQDAAFCFTYQDNLDLLRESGAELVPFSPLNDAELPANVDALYLPGGYPELHAAALADNASMHDSVRDFAASGRPIYAECGGMLYLGQSLSDANGNAYDMPGVLPLRCAMTPRLIDFGYVTVTTTRATLLGPAGLTLRGQSFHYSQLQYADPALRCAYRIEYSLSGKQQDEGYTQGMVLASYVHLHFRTSPGIAENFIAAAAHGRFAAKQEAHA